MDTEEGDVLGGETMEGSSVVKESEEGLAVVVGRVIREKMVNGSIRQLSVCLSKIVISDKDQIGTALVCQKDQDVGTGPEGAESLVLKRGYIAIGGEGFGKVGLRNSGQDMRDIEFKGVGRGEL